MRSAALLRMAASATGLFQRAAHDVDRFDLPANAPCRSSGLDLSRITWDIEHSDPSIGYGSISYSRGGHSVGRRGEFQREPNRAWTPRDLAAPEPPEEVGGGEGGGWRVGAGGTR